MSAILDKLDYLVLIAVVALLAAVLFGKFGTGARQADAAIATSKEASEAFSDRLAENRYEESEGARLLNDIAGYPDLIDARWAQKSGPKGPSAEGLFFHEPSLSDLRAGREFELRFFPPRNLSLAADLGSMKISWELDELSTVTVTGFLIYRSSGGGDFERLAEIPVGTNVHIDRAVVPGVLYAYRVASRTNDPALVRRGKGESEPSRGVQERAKRDYEIAIERWNGKKAAVSVRKYIAGEWIQREFLVGEGDTVGSNEGDQGDFRTNCRVKSLTTREEMVEEEREEVSFDAAGRVVMVDGQAKRSLRRYQTPRTVLTLQLENELGQSESLTFNQ